MVKIFAVLCHKCHHISEGIFYTIIALGSYKKNGISIGVSGYKDILVVVD